MQPAFQRFRVIQFGETVGVQHNSSQMQGF